MPRHSKSGGVFFIPLKKGNVSPRFSSDFASFTYLNTTGSFSIYCGNLPTTPWAKNKEGRGPAWANSLLEVVNVPAELKEKLTTQEPDDEAGLNDRTSQMQKKNSDRLELSLTTTTQ